MAIRAPIVLTDASTPTPVNRTYFPVSLVKDVMSFVDRTQAVMLGQNKLEIRQRMATQETRATKLSGDLSFPILSQASGGTSAGLVAEPQVSHTNRAGYYFVFSDKATRQERIDALAQLRDLLNEAITTNAVADYDIIY